MTGLVLPFVLGLAAGGLGVWTLGLLGASEQSVDSWGRGQCRTVASICDRLEREECGRAGGGANHRAPVGGIHRRPGARHRAKPA